jgi:hypothetical protein
MIDPFETPQERRARYLRAAIEAREIGLQALNEGMRERYLKLETIWLTLADEVETGGG